MTLFKTENENGEVAPFKIGYIETATDSITELQSIEILFQMEILQIQLGKFHLLIYLKRKMFFSHYVSSIFGPFIFFSQCNLSLSIIVFIWKRIPIFTFPTISNVSKRIETQFRELLWTEG